MPDPEPERLPIAGGLSPSAPQRPVATPTVIIDRCALSREGIQQALDETAFTIVASTADPNGLHLPEDLSGRPFLVILGSSSDFADDVAVLRHARLCCPEGVMVSLRRDCTHQQAAALLRAGAAAIMPIPDRPERLVDALDLVMLGQHVVPLYLMGRCIGGSGEQAARPLESPRGPAERGMGGKLAARLSTREIEIVRCLLAGDSNRAIARRLMIAEATVKVHVKAILRKIKAKNRTQAAIWALNNIDAVDAADAVPTG